MVPFCLLIHTDDHCLQTLQESFQALIKYCVCHPPIRSVMVSEPWLCSLLSVSSAACRLMHSFSRLSLLRSSRQHLSCSSRTLASSCCSCLLLSVWVLRSLVAASDSARSSVLASSSWWRQQRKKGLKISQQFYLATVCPESCYTQFLFKYFILEKRETDIVQFIIHNLVIPV